MKKKPVTILMLVCLMAIFLIPTIAFSAQDPSIKSVSVNVPVSSGLTGSDNAAKSFLLDLPSGVVASTIQTGSFKYSGNNEIISSISIENGKIKLKLKGNEKTETFQVRGTAGDFDKTFITVPGNSIWRYSDGRRWQINDWNSDTGITSSYNVNATDSLTPSEEPPKRIVTTKSDVADPSTAIWYRNEANKVSFSDIITSSIKPFILPLINGSGSAVYKGNQLVVTHTIPTSNFAPEKVPESFEKGPWVLGRLYYARVPYYFTANAKVTTYSYAGVVSFDYKLSTEPTLTGEVQLLKPNPNPTQATGSDIPVTLSLKGLLSAYADTSNIQEWVFYAKESGNDGSLLTKKDYSKVLTSTQTFDFKIPKSKTAASKFTQEYTLSVVVRFTKPIVTADGTISSLTQSFSASAGTYTGGPTTPPTATPTPAPSNLKPPVARISMPDQVVAGEKFIVSGADSFDSDGTIVKYTWQHPNVQDALYGKSSDTRYGLDSIDTTQTITLTVTDNDGLTATTSRDIKVVAPAPAAKLQILGTLKENRKITLHNASKNVSDDFPIIPGKTRFTVSAVSGGTNTDIKVSGALVGADDVDILIKVAGQYQATLYVENTAGYTGMKSITFTVEPDQAPVPYISMPYTVYRDPTNGNKASITLEDLSISPDYDFLARRVWEYRYDSDNDGNFAEETWVLISNGNLDRLNFYPTEVGRYEIRLTVKEEFGQPTIDEFVTVNDRKSADTATQNVTERIVTVLNRPPLSDWSW